MVFVRKGVCIYEYNMYKKKNLEKFVWNDNLLYDNWNIYFIKNNF